ncbi:DNA invertase Pin-like site-specific DNA recombinase [Hydromonas duriensis]|uniref:DNA invertase Pin-like site-specific DNA recombinase n=1 Tax=Hydromonas duriensis TaxID=1527608 RepID=A0A4R6XZW9_9BURK|nr:DNA invertase Pin-like site-specific DNA recombinase [Hydromonas duriensis]
MLDLRLYAECCGYDVVGVWKEAVSEKSNQYMQRNNIMALAKVGSIDVILVKKLSRWCNSIMDLTASVQVLNNCGVSLMAQNGLQFDLESSEGKLMSSMMSALADFESDLLSERVRSGILEAQARGVVFGRRKGQRFKSDSLAPKVLELVENGHSYRQVGLMLNISKNTVLDIVKRNRINNL